MTVSLSPELEKAAIEEAQKAGQSPQEIVLAILREQLLPPQGPTATPSDWERLLTGAAVDCGVTLSDHAVSSDGLYE
jgi:hypothetical protein